MFGYGALLNNSLGEQLRAAWYDFSLLVRDVPFYWYIATLVALLLFVKLLIKK